MQEQHKSIFLNFGNCSLKKYAKCCIGCKNYICVMMLCESCEFLIWNNCTIEKSGMFLHAYVNLCCFNDLLSYTITVHTYKSKTAYVSNAVLCI